MSAWRCSTQAIGPNFFSKATSIAEAGIQAAVRKRRQHVQNDIALLGDVSWPAGA